MGDAMEAVGIWVEQEFRGYLGEKWFICAEYHCPSDKGLAGVVLIQTALYPTDVELLLGNYTGSPVRYHESKEDAVKHAIQALRSNKLL